MNHGAAGTSNQTSVSMNFQNFVNNTRARSAHALAITSYQARGFIHSRPLASAGILLFAGLVLGFTGRSVAGMAQVSMLQAKADTQQAQLEQVRRGAQQEVNAMAARLGELQAQANRLNALGERLTRVGQLQDGEFDFDEPVGVGGNDAAHDMAPAELDAGVDALEKKFAASGQQLSVLEALLFNRELDKNATPSRLLMKVGELVRAGQEMAKAGSSGRSTGAHVHFEVWQDGVVVNPRKFLGHNNALARHGPRKG